MFTDHLPSEFRIAKVLIRYIPKVSMRFISFHWIGWIFIHLSPIVGRLYYIKVGYSVLFRDLWFKCRGGFDAILHCLVGSVAELNMYGELLSVSSEFRMMKFGMSQTFQSSVPHIHIPFRVSSGKWKLYCFITSRCPYQYSFVLYDCFLKTYCSAIVPAIEENNLLALALRGGLEHPDFVD